MTRFVIAAADLAAIDRAAAAAWPREACGLLLGLRTGEALTVARVVIAENVSETPERRFEVDPRALFAAHRAAREAGQEVLGPWHSHPNGADRPSATDTARARLAGEAWLIVPVTRAGAGSPRAWLFDGGGFTEMELA